MIPNDTENMQDSRQIVDVRFAEDGAMVYLRLRPHGGGRGVQLRLRVEEYAALPFTPSKGKILADEELERLYAAEQASTAYQRGANILGYGANSSRSLQKKLVQKGYSAKVAARAAEELSARGYLCEKRDACQMARRMMQRGRGLRRILQDLRARGYGEEALAAVRDELAEEDFTALCCLAAQKKCRELPTERQERQKLMNYLLRCGFESSDARAALRSLEVFAKEKQQE